MSGIGGCSSYYGHTREVVSSLGTDWLRCAKAPAVDPDGQAGISGASRPLNRWALARVPWEEPWRCTLPWLSQSRPSLLLMPFTAWGRGWQARGAREGRPSSLSFKSFKLEYDHTSLYKFLQFYNFYSQIYQCFLFSVQVSPCLEKSFPFHLPRLWMFIHLFFFWYIMALLFKYGSHLEFILPV